MSPVSAEAAADPVAAKRPHLRPGSGRVERLLARFHQIRDFTNALCAGLEPEDCVVQSMPDVSPTKWHLAHTTWFFETFILKKFSPGYRSEIPQYAYLFNSYYNAAGDMHRRDLRGLISRPTVREAKRYRASIDSHIDNLLSKADEKLLDEIEPILILGFHHEQQHQELLVTDIKHVFAQNPLYPVFRERKLERGACEAGLTEFARSTFSTSKRRLSRLAMTVADSPTTTKDRGIERWSPHFRLLHGRSQTASIWHSSKTMVMPVRNSGYRSGG